MGFELRQAGLGLLEGDLVLALLEFEFGDVGVVRGVLLPLGLERLLAAGEQARSAVDLGLEIPEVFAEAVALAEGIGDGPGVLLSPNSPGR
ncbi:MAG TPA: hypothetical protein VM529_16935, partial [Gemmata sp.]|nr:hypothetical protein [Gemmata sp.]